MGGVPFYALFKTSYSAANTVVYKRLPASVRYSSIVPGGFLDFAFSAISGLPSAPASITFASVLGDPPVASTITVGANGLVSF